LYRVYSLFKEKRLQNATLVLLLFITVMAGQLSARAQLVIPKEAPVVAPKPEPKSTKPSSRSSSSAPVVAPKPGPKSTPTPKLKHETTNLQEPMSVKMSYGMLNLAGKWRGSLSQPGLGKEFTFSMNLTQEGEHIAGTSSIAQGEYTGVMNLEGSVKEMEFQFRETSIVEGQYEPGAYWLLKTGCLSYSDGEIEGLNGTWESEGHSGTIQLTKAKIQNDATENSSSEPQQVTDNISVNSDSAPSELSAWAVLIKRKVDRVFIVPPNFQMYALEDKAEVSFRVDRNGLLLGTPTITKQATNPALGESGVNAIKLAAPFPPLPESYPHAEQMVVFGFTVTQ